MTNRQSDRGAIDGIVLLSMCALTSFAVVVAVVVSLFIGREQTRTAADLSALAAAQTQDCEIAATTARANGATVRRCKLQGSEVYVTVQMPTQFGPFLLAAGAPRHFEMTSHAGA